MPKSIRKTYTNKTNKQLVSKCYYKKPKSKSSKRTVLLKGGWGGCDYKKPKRKSSKRTFLLKGGWGETQTQPQRKPININKIGGGWGKPLTTNLIGGGWGKPLTTNLIGGGWGGNPVVYDVNRKYYRDRIIKKYFKKHF